jgi:N-acyl-D-aspartate/D-glutamate deacylase
MPIAIRGGTVIDGTGSPARRADLLVEDGLIAAVGEDATAGATVDDTIDAAGMVVAVMGAHAYGHEADQEQIDKMARLADEAMAAGAIGVATSAAREVATPLPVTPGGPKWSRSWVPWREPAGASAYPGK